MVTARSSGSAIAVTSDLTLNPERSHAMNKIYEPGFRPRCIVCLEELLPAPSSNDGEPVYRGFLPCPDHPNAEVLHRNENEVTGSPTSPAIAVTIESLPSAEHLPRGFNSAHYLKTLPRWFVPAWAGLKPFEIRKNDRFFHAGDLVVLREYDPRRPCKEQPPELDPPADCICKYTGRQIRGQITYVFQDETVVTTNADQTPGVTLPGVFPGYCVFGYKLLSKVFAT